MAAGPVPIGSHSFPISSPVKESGGNQHPYAIKTTSTGILTRSNSTGASGKLPNYYAAASPSTPSPALGKPQGRGHRHTKSLSNASIPSLPLPPSPSTPVKLANWTSSGNVSDSALPGKLKRRDTLPSLSSSPRTPKPIQLSDLHDNPKLWTPSHLSVYLTSALRVKGGGSIPAPVAQDIAAFVVAQRISGRAFLRLTESDLEEMGINHLWRDALLSASRSLRKTIIKGRILGFGNDPPSSLSPSSSKRRVPSTVEEEDPAQDSKAPPGGFRAGRVRGIVESLERSGSSASSHSSRSSASELDLDVDDEEVRRELKEAGLWDDPQDGGFASGELTSGSELEEDAVPRGRRSMSWGEMPKPFPPHVKQLSSPSAKAREANFADQSTIAADSGAEHYASALSGDEEHQKHNAGEHEQEPTMEELLASEPLSSSWALASGEEQTMRKVPEIVRPDLQQRKSSIKRLPQLFTETPTRNGVKSRQPQLLEQEADVQAISMAATEAARNAQLLEEFRKRLEDMEKQLDEMEVQNARKEREAVAERTRRAEWEHRQREAELARASAVHSQDVVMPNLSSILSSTLSRRPKQNDASKRTDDRASVHNDLDEMSASALPSYVLLVGMGVCAVVLRVLFRKLPFKKN